MEDLMASIVSLTWGAASFFASEPPSFAECHAGEASAQHWGPTQAGGAAVPGAQEPDAVAGGQQGQGGDGVEEREQGQQAQCGPGHERATGCGRGARGGEWRIHFEEEAEEGEVGYCESGDTMRRTGGVKSVPENHL